MANNLGHIIVCEEIFQGPDGAPILRKPLGMLIPVGLPSNYSFSISVGFINLQKNNHYKAQVVLNDPKGNEVFKHDIDFRIEENNLPGSAAFSVFNINCRNVVLTVEGDFTVLVKLNDQEKTLILPVVKQGS